MPIYTTFHRIFQKARFQLTAWFFQKPIFHISRGIDVIIFLLTKVPILFQQISFFWVYIVHISRNQKFVSFIRIIYLFFSASSYLIEKRDFFNGLLKNLLTYTIYENYMNWIKFFIYITIFIRFKKFVVPGFNVSG